MLFVGSASAQPLTYFRNLDVSDGLSSNQVFSFFEDREGYMWIGTGDGLQRYDGVSFQTFYHDPQRPENTIAGNDIGHHISEDPKGRIWVPVKGQGVSRYDPKTNSFTNFNSYNGKFGDKVADGVVSTVFIGPDVYVISYQNVVRIDSLDNVEPLLRPFGSETTPSIGDLRRAVVDSDRWIWILTRRGILRYDTQTNTWNHPADPGAHAVVPATRDQLSSMGVDAGRKLWFTKWDRPAASAVRHLYAFTIATGQLDSFPIAPTLLRENSFSDLITRIHVDRAGVWLGTDGLGLLRFEPSSQTWTQYAHEPDWAGSIRPGMVNNIYEDSRSNLWVGTPNGLSILPRSRQLFSNYTSLPDASGNAISLTDIITLKTSPKGDIWLGQRPGGMIRLSSGMTILDRGILVPQATGEYRDYVNVRHVDKNYLYCHVWVSGLFRVDRRAGATIAFADFTDAGELVNVFVDRSGTTWAWSKGWFGKVNADDRTAQLMEMPRSAWHGKPDLVLDMTEDDRGYLWLGMDGTGLLCFDPRQMKIVRQLGAVNDSLPGIKVPAILFAQGKLFMSFERIGLGVFDLRTNTLKTYTKSDGLCSSTVNDLATDSDGDVWVFSNNGISWFDMEHDRLRSFSADDGMLSSEISSGELLANGHMMLVTPQGLIEFDPKALKRKNQPIEPRLTSLQVYDQSINLADWLGERNTITVPWNRNYLRAEFSALEFFDPDKIKFAYRLDGAEPDWNYTDYRPVATYTSLRGGSYDLLVKCTNVDGEWGPELRIPVFVTTPFYRKLWFYGLLLLTAIGLGYLLYRYQLNRRLAMERVRNRLARDLHDDIGSTLSSISIYSNVAQKAVDKDIAEGKQLLTRIGTNAREMMQSMDDIVWAIDPAHDELDHVVSRMRAYALPVLEAQDIELRMHVDTGIRSLKLDMVKRRNLFLIFKEAINNIAKYSAATVVDVSITREGRNLLMRVSDNGRGFDAAAKSERHGLKNMRSRADEVKGSCEIRSVTGQGTNVAVSVPV